MIRARIYQDGQGTIVRIMVKGHARSAEHGRDLVCAAVSTLITNFVNSVEQIYGVDPRPKVASGFFDVKVVQDETVQILARSLALGLEGISQEHGVYLQVAFTME